METQTKTQQPTAPAKCTNADRGIRKRISEPLYPADILSDRELNTCSLKAYGAYCKFLVQIIHDNTDHITDDLPGWARFWACRPPEARAIIAELKKRKTCTVTLRHKIVTLTNRRRQRARKARAAAAARQRKSRMNKGDSSTSGPMPHAPCPMPAPARHAPVTGKKPLPSSSSSLSSPIHSSSTTSSRSVAKATPHTTRLIDIQDYADIHDPSRDPLDLARAITRDPPHRFSLPFFRDAYTRMGDLLFRGILAELWGELKTTSRIRNPGALLCAKIRQALQRITPTEAHT